MKFLFLLAASLVFRLIDVNSGLPENNVRNMLMLPDGMMCIQTSSMLNLYDGARLRSYRYDPGQIPYSEYSGMTEAWYDAPGHRIWCVTKDRMWVFDMTAGAFLYDTGEILSGMGIQADAAGFCIDDDGILWLLSPDGILWKKSLSGSEAASSQAVPCSGSGVVMERSGDILRMLSQDGSLVEYSISRNGVTGVLDLGDAISPSTSSHLEMTASADGNLWVMTDKCVALVSGDRTDVKTVLDMPSGSSDLFTSISTDLDGNLWVGTARSGVTIIDGVTLSNENLPSLKLTSGEEIYHHTDISKIYSDSRGGIWIATLTEGLLYRYTSSVRFGNVNHGTISSGTFVDEGVKCMLESEDGRLLVGTIKGLLEYDPKTRSLTVPWKELSDELVISLYRDSRGRIWAGTFYDGAFCIDGRSVRNYRYPEMGSVDVSYQEGSPNYNCVRSFYEDADGTLMVSVYGGLGTLDPSDGSISLLRDTHPELKRLMIIRSICEVSPGVLLASGDNGSFRYATASDSVFFTSDEIRTSCNMALLDSRGLLWSSGGSGLKVTDASGNTIYEPDESELLYGSTVMGMAEDDYGSVWVSAYGHIFCVKVAGDSGDGYEFSIVKYGRTDGMDAGPFFQNSILKHSDGHICFGGARGITTIMPEELSLSAGEYRPVILSYTADGLRHDLSSSSEITLRSRSLPLEVAFSNFDFANPDHVLYSYMLEGFDKSWQTVPSGELPRARYSLICPGRYTFRVKSCSLGGGWTESSIPVVITPPLMASGWAVVLYVLLFSLMVYETFRHYRKKEEVKLQMRMESEKIRRQEELDQMKFRFFTNISHELRTPLSLIMLPLQSLMKENGDRRLGVIQKNATELLELVNHLLDFRKLEMGGEKLTLSTGDAAEFVTMVSEKFRDTCEGKGLTFEIMNETDSPIMAFDRPKVRKIVNNLLSNAVKFTPEGGYVSLRMEHSAGDFRITVSDTGSGMSSEDRERLFDRFYRSSSAADSAGTGIGLNLVKQYVDMMSGRVEVGSELGKGSVFSVSIPDNLRCDPTASVPEKHEEEKDVHSATSASGARSRIMVVDDNADFREYLSAELSSRFDVSAAGDGAGALALMGKEHPELIVCDVMMPQMDGFEFTKRVRDDVETSHIPVILLTARLSDDVRLQGYETGADAYITKPFRMELLIARINNLLEDRRSRIKQFSTSPDYSPMEVTVTSMDQKLMQKIMASIERNMSNTEYSVEMLASDVSMHRMNLYRKLQAIAGTTPLEFIRTMRLKRAAQLLSGDSGLNVSEVADMVGFSTTKYFTKYFKEMFGVTPSRYAAAQTDTGRMTR